jgi:hypothetical protein
MRGGDVEYWHNIHNQAPFFMREEAYEEDVKKSRSDE